MLSIHFIVGLRSDNDNGTATLLGGDFPCRSQRSRSNIARIILNAMRTLRSLAC
jgi:hypothetical protein